MGPISNTSSSPTKIDELTIFLLARPDILQHPLLRPPIVSPIIPIFERYTSFFILETSPLSIPLLSVTWLWWKSPFPSFLPLSPFFALHPTSLRSRIVLSIHHLRHRCSLHIIQPQWLLHSNPNLLFPLQLLRYLLSAHNVPTQRLNTHPQSPLLDSNASLVARRVAKSSPVTFAALLIFLPHLLLYQINRSLPHLSPRFVSRRPPAPICNKALLASGLNSLMRWATLQIINPLHPSLHFQKPLPLPTSKTCLMSFQMQRPYHMSSIPFRWVQQTPNGQVPTNLFALFYMEIWGKPMWFS